MPERREADRLRSMFANADLPEWQRAFILDVLSDPSPRVIPCPRMAGKKQWYQMVKECAKALGYKVTETEHGFGINMEVEDASEGEEARR